QRQRHVFAHRQRREESAGLKQHSETPTDFLDLAIVHRRDFFAEDFDRAGGRFHYSDDVAEERAFAATAPAHDHERLAAMNLEREIVDDGATPEGAGEIGDFDDDRSVKHGKRNDE